MYVLRDYKGDVFYACTDATRFAREASRYAMDPQVKIDFVKSQSK